MPRLAVGFFGPVMLTFQPTGGVPRGVAYFAFSAGA